MATFTRWSNSSNWGFTALVVAYAATLDFLSLFLAKAELYAWIFHALTLAIVIPLLIIFLQTRLAQSRKMFFVLLGLYALFHLSFQLAAYYGTQRISGDQAVYEQILWNFVHTGFFGGTLPGQYIMNTVPDPVSYYAGHNESIVLLMSIPYFFFRSTLTIFVVQTGLIVLGGWLIWQFLGGLFKEYHAALNIAPFALLLHPAIAAHAVFYATAFVLPLFAWAALSYQRDRRWQFLLSLFLLTMTRETIFPALFVWALLAWVQKRQWPYIVGPVVIALFSTILYFLIITPMFYPGQSSPWIEGYLPLILAGKFDIAGVASYWFQMLAPWAGLPLGSLLVLLAGPDLLLNALTSVGTDQTMIVSGRFQRLAIAALYLATAASIRWIATNWHTGNSTNSIKADFVGKAHQAGLQLINRLKRIVPSSQHLDSHQVSTVLWATIVALGVANGYIGWWNIGNNYLDLVTRDWQSDWQCINPVLKTNDPVACDFKLCAFFGGREKLWSIGYVNFTDEIWDSVDWIVLRKEIAESYDTSAWQQTCSGESIVVFQR
jgi:hypothetical protein